MRQAVIAMLEARKVRAIVKRSPYGDHLGDVPPGLFSYWRKTAPGEFPGIPVQAQFYTRALESLLLFFDCVANTGQLCGLPSRAADSVWHAWLQMDRDNLDQFCLRHFGRLIAHVESGHIEGQMGIALAACLVESRRLEVQGPASPTLSRLFTLDRALRMPLGFNYTIEHGVVACARLDRAGLPSGLAHYPACLTPRGLLDAGLISEAQYELASPHARRGRARSADQSGGGCGGIASATGAGDAAACADGASSTGDAGDGGDGGASCGGGCGGD
jgi:hypothetical protein